MCLLATAVLAWAVAHGRSPYPFENPAIAWLGSPSAVRAWTDLAELLAAPAIGAVLVVSCALGLVRRALFRVAVFTALAAAALLINENVAKPLVQRTYNAELTFPSGHVTAVSATALAMWLALYPLLGKRARIVTLVLGVTWALLMSLAVVGALLAHATGRRRVHLAIRRHRHCRRCGLRADRDSETLHEHRASLGVGNGEAGIVRHARHFQPNPTRPLRRRAQGAG